MPHTATTINRLRLRSAHAEPLRARLRTSQLLEGLDLRPTQISPSAILIVRQLEDPLPQTLSLNRQHGPAPSWQRAVRSQLRKLYHESERPARGPIPTAALSVLFADEAELWACLTLDLARDVASSRWWWQLILRQFGGPGYPPPARVLAQNAQLIPAIFSRLMEWHVEQEVLRRLTGQDVVQLLEQLMLIYAVADFRSAPKNSTPEHALPAHSEQHPPMSPTHLGPSAAQLSPDHASHPRAPWSKWMPVRASSEHAREHQAFVGVALALYHCPRLVQSPEFERAARRWWQGIAPSVLQNETVGDKIGAQTERHHSPPKSGPEAMSADPRSGPPTVPPRSRLEKKEAKDLFPKEGADDLLSEEKLSTFGPSVKPPMASRVGDDATAETGGRFLPVDEGKETNGGATVQKSDVAAADRAPILLPAGVTTEIGGALYLINVMERMGLPRSFKEGWQVDARISCWGLLEILARGLLAPSGNRYVDDPLWLMLLQLDGRESAESVADSFSLPAKFQPPQDWPQIRSEDEWMGWSLHSGQLLDPLGPAPLRWLTLVLPHVLTWLRRTLFLGDDLSDYERAKTFSCLRSRLYVTSTHVDLVMNIDQIFLPVRMSGLDQDPGWLPHWGRVIRFHFEE